MIYNNKESCHGYRFFFSNKPTFAQNIISNAMICLEFKFKLRLLLLILRLK